MGVKEDLAQIEAWSRQNLDGWVKEGLSSKVLGKVESLKEHFFPEGCWVFHHRIGAEENIPAIVSSGHLLSYEELSRRGIKLAGTHTIIEAQQDDIFANVSYQEDPYKDFVYFRLNHKTLTRDHKEDGVRLEVSGIPDEAWFNFQDPQQLSLADISRSCMCNLTTSSFNKFDVFKGKDIEDALIIRSLQYLRWARALALTYPDKFPKKKALELMPTCMDIGEDDRFIAQNPVSGKIGLDDAYMRSADFLQDFAYILKALLEITASRGQITLPVKVDVFEASFTCNGETRSVSSWKKEMFGSSADKKKIHHRKPSPDSKKHKVPGHKK